jgi:2-polyprenyl-6-methoxyphenol hydroxylase-like FAD-dependent oxidoreductase
LLSHTEPDGTVHAYVALKVPADWLGGIDFADTDAAKAAVLACFPGWDKRLLALIADADGPMVPRLIHALPVGHRWSRVPGVTLLGDAAHLMSPFAGEGANLAMLDGAELATAIAGGDRESGLAAYEERMFTRSAAAAAESADNLATSFRPDAADLLVVQFAGGGADREMAE